MMNDIISRQAAIDALMEMVKQHKNDESAGELLHWTGIKAMLECLPSAWIDVKDRLPEETCECLCASNICRIKTLIFTPDLEKLYPYVFIGKKRPGFVEYYSDVGYVEMKVTHWMPLPEPPKK